MKSDARVRYTRERISGAFFGLLREKPLSKVTVREICERAEINRATFYHHYRDPRDLFERTEEELLTSAGDNVRRVLSSGQRDVTETFLEKLRQAQNDPASPPLHRFFAEDPTLSSKFMDIFYRESAVKIGAGLTELSDEERETVYAFLISGSGGVLNMWVRGGLAATAEEVTERLYRLAEGTLKAAKKTRETIWRE